MVYLKSLFYNFLAVFFSNHLLPGISVVDQTKLPHIGGDLLFALILGALNMFVYPALKLFRQEVTIPKMILIVLILNFASYGILKLLPVGIHVESVEGYILASAAVSICGFLTNYFEMKRGHHHPPKEPLDLP
jgi:uncharacterized membrane protein YvlD (DUF360 family)